MGIGYIGLQTAVVVANNGYKVFGIDIDHNLVFFLLTIILNKNRSTPLTKKFLFLVKSTPKTLTAKILSIFGKKNEAIDPIIIGFNLTL